MTSQTETLLNCKRLKFYAEIRKEQKKLVLNAKRYSALLPPAQFSDNNPTRNSLGTLEDLIQRFILAQGQERAVFANQLKTFFLNHSWDEASAEPLVDFIINTELVARINKLISDEELISDEPKLLYEIAQILINLTAFSSDFIDHLFDEHSLTPILKLIGSCTYEKLVDQYVWVLANIAGDSDFSKRDELFKKCTADFLISVYLEKNDGVTNFSEYKIKNQELLNVSATNLLWFIHNMLRGPPFPKYVWVKSSVHILQSAYLSDSVDWELQGKIYENYSLLAEICSDDELEELLCDSSELVATILRKSELICGALDSSHLNMVIDAFLRLASGGDQCIEKLIDLDLADFITVLLQRKGEWNLILKGVALFSALSKGGSRAIQKLYTYKFLIHQIMMALNDGNLKVQEECIRGMCFSVIHGREFMTKKLIELGFLETFADFLKKELMSADVLCLMIDALQSLISDGKVLDQEDKENTCGELSSEIKRIMLKNGCNKAIEDLQNHPDFDVYEKVSSLIENNFTYEVLEDLT